LYGDQRDELIVAASNQAGDACLVATAALNITATPMLDTRAPVVIDASCGQLGQLAVRDLDGDNAPDLLLLTGAPETARNLLVLWNDGSGGFSTDQVTTLNGDGENPQAFTLFQRSDERGPRVAYVTESALRLITTTTGQRDLAASAQTLREDLSHATGVIATDLDGDTVMDLAIAADGSIHVLLAELE
jgi:hypothetical protein